MFNKFNIFNDYLTHEQRENNIHKNKNFCFILSLIIDNNKKKFFKNFYLQSLKVQLNLLGSNFVILKIILTF